ncbi:cell wall-binding repeat-containing protein [Metabacillus idriensis]|uniref:cell wall-binding repeat-containing protein n=1 Tax=Metabacillus idriensis TaxID=324768 RepID=UPI00174E8E4A|nr:cell wall-binding repeat-containing protein [Metabacillus idriensis]
MKSHKSWVLGFIMVLLLLLVPSVSFAEKVLVIDPGHGGKFSGTCGLTGNSTGFCEKKANLIVSQKVRDLLKASDIKVYLTRDTDKEFAPYLKNADGSSTGGDFDVRMKIANGYAKGNNDNSVFISIHHNAHPSNTYVKGFETYFYNGVDHAKPEYPHDPLQIKYLGDNQRLAGEIHPRVLSKLGSIDRGIADDQSFYVIRNAQMPAVLVELGFMTNREEEARIKTSDFQNKAAQAIVDAAVNYFKVYEVYDSGNTKLLTTKSKDQALQFAQKQSKFVRVFDKNAQKDIYTKNAPYAVYHKTNGIVKEFFTQNEAIAFAQNQSNTRVISKNDGFTIWSNFITAKYDLYVKGVKNGSYFDFEYARYIAQQNSPNARVVNNKSGEVVHTNIANDKVTRNLHLDKLVGADRYQTAVNVSKKMYPSGFADSKLEKAIIIATGTQYADALSAGPLSRKYEGAPILLVRGNALDASVANEITRLKANKAIIIGGEAAVTKGIETQLQSMKLTTDRINGSDRFHTNRLILNRLGNVDGYFIASGRNYPDALGAAPLATQHNWAILLSDTNSIYYDARVKLKDKHAIILGGNAVLTSNIDNQVKLVAPKSYIRLAGSDRYETLAKVLWHFDPYLTSESIMVSTGTNFPDALTAAPLSHVTKAPLILTGKDFNKSLESYIMSYGGKHHMDEVTMIGGAVPQAVTDEIVNRVR